MVKAVDCITLPRDHDVTGLPSYGTRVWILLPTNFISIKIIIKNQIGGSAAACKCNVAPSSSLKWHEIVIPTCKQIYISKLFSKVEINLFTIIWLHLITNGWYHIEVNYLICNQVLPWDQVWVARNFRYPVKSDNLTKTKDQPQG
jgi:hypothetical protein